jgi:hypothetical protein
VNVEVALLRAIELLGAVAIAEALAGGGSIWTAGNPSADTHPR